MDPAQACTELGGAATFAELLSAGVTRRTLTRAVSVGEIFRIAKGIYAIPAATSIVRAEAVYRGTHTCVTALARHGLPVQRKDSKVHLAIPASANLAPRLRSPCDVRLHWHEGSLAAASTVLGAIDAAALCLSDMDQLAAIDAALNSGKLTVEDLDRLRVTAASRIAWLRQHCDPTCQSPPETFARVAMREAGLPVRTQVPITGVGRVDFVVDGTVVVEIDGKTYHMNERAFWEDRRRDRVAQLGGLMALRYTREDVERDLSGLVEEVTAVVNGQRLRAGRRVLQVRSARPTLPWVGARPWSRSARR